MELIANKQVLKLMNPVSVRTGNVETYPIQLTFSEEYKNLAKTIIYLADEETIKQSVTNETEVNIPFEVLEKLREHLYIGVFAYEIKDKLIVKRYSTNLVSVPVSEGSYIDGYEPVIEPSIWERYIYEMQKILDNAELVLSETNQIKEATNLIKDETNQIKEETEKLKNETNLIKDETEEIKNEVSTIRDETNQIKEDTEKIKNETLVIKNDTNLIKDETLIIKNETNQIKEDTEKIKNTARDFVSAVTFAKAETNPFDGHLYFVNEESLGNMGFQVDANGHLIYQV